MKIGILFIVQLIGLTATAQAGYFRARAQPGALRLANVSARTAALRPAVVRRDVRPLEFSPVAAALNRGDWSDPALSDPKQTLLLAEQALQNGEISSEQFWTTVLRWEAAEDFNVDLGAAQPLLNGDGTLSEFGRQAAQVARIGHDDGLGLYGRRGLDEKGAAQLAARLAAAPRSEQWGWSALLPPDKTPFVRLPGLELYGPAGTPGRIAVAPFTFLQEGIYADYGDQAVRLLPSFSAASQEQVIEGIDQGGRIFALSYPGRSPNVAEEHGELGRFLFSMHDFGHAKIGSRIDATLRRMIGALYEMYQEYQEEFRSGKPVRREGFAVPVFETGRNALNDLADLNIRSDNRGRGAVVGTLLSTFGLSSLYLAGRHLARHPESWNARGFSAEQALEQLGATARKGYSDALRDLRRGRVRRFLREFLPLK